MAAGYKAEYFELALDWPEVVSWWDERKKRHLPKEHLPDPGFTILDGFSRPCMVAWLYVCPSAKVAFLHNLTTRPGLSLKEARLAFKELMERIEFYCQEFQIGIIYGAGTPAICKMGKAFGFVVDEDRLEYAMQKGITVSHETELAGV